MRTLRFLLRKEFLQIFRDRLILGMLFAMPLVQLLVLANAATFEVTRARLYVMDHDRSRASRAVVDRLAASGRFTPVARGSSSAAADAAMLGREIDAIVAIPVGFERDLVRDRGATLQLILNAEDGAAAGVMQSYAAAILARYSSEIGVGPGRARIEVRERGWYNADLRYRDFMVPAILVVLVTMVGTLLTAMNIVREKEAGTLDQLNVTPIGRVTFIAAKLIPFSSLALLDLALGLGVARFVFGVPMRGSLLIVFAAAAIYLLCALGIGLWISTIAETQQQAMFVTFSLMMVYLLMSGIFTPVSGMPVWAQWLAEASPVMHFAKLMRAVLLKGAGIGDVLRELAMLAGIGTAVLTLAVRQYRKRTA
jgi:ABC-2 type transport system permease protein